MKTLLIKYMGWGNIRSADDAVSPVISVILMVAIVVILGAVVSVFSLGIAEDVDSNAPGASFEFKPLDNGDIEVTHSSGDSINGDNLRFAGVALEKTTTGSITEWTGDDDVTSGDSAVINVKAGETLILVWQLPNSDQSATLAEYDLPDDVAPTASIGSIRPYSRTDDVDVNNITFNRVEKVWLVVDDEGSNKQADFPTQRQYISTNGKSVNVDSGFGYRIAPDETVTVTVYETDQEINQLAQCSGTSNDGITKC